jgi:hypothetical protein
MGDGAVLTPPPFSPQSQGKFVSFAPLFHRVPRKPYIITLVYYINMAIADRINQRAAPLPITWVKGTVEMKSRRNFSGFFLKGDVPKPFFNSGGQGRGTISMNEEDDHDGPV